MPKKSINNACLALKEKKICILLDDAVKNPQGYLVQAAEHASTESISKMVCLARSVICVALPAERIEELRLLPMGHNWSSTGNFDFSVSVEAREGVTTGISASDRAKTLKTIAVSKDSKFDLVTPGHIFPIKAKKGGVLEKSAPAEAAVDLIKLAELSPAATICHCLDLEGNFASEDDLKLLSKKEGFPLVRISEIIHNRLSKEVILEQVASASLPTEIAGDFKAVCFRSKIDEAEHLVLIKGQIAEKDASGKQLPVLTRVQAENKLSDLLGLGKLSSKKRIESCLEMIKKEGRGIFVYIRHPRKDMLKAQVENKSQDNTVNRATEFRGFGVGAQILSSIGAKRIKLISNFDREIAGISAFDLEIVERVPLN